MTETQNGKYEILYNTYERFEPGNLKKATFSAKDDFEALKKVAAHCDLYANEDNFYETKEDALANDVSEEDLNDCFGCAYVRGLKDPETIAKELQNCDGQDYIFYIKRPDGSYLYDSGETAVEDWDD